MFQGQDAIRVTAGVAASAIPIPSFVDASGNSVGIHRRHTASRIVNYHATQLIYVATNRTATATDNDAIVAPLKEAILAIPPTAGYFSILGSGAGTTGVIDFGTNK